MVAQLAHFKAVEDQNVTPGLKFVSKVTMELEVFRSALGCVPEFDGTPTATSIPGRLEFSHNTAW